MYQIKTNKIFSKFLNQEITFLLVLPNDFNINNEYNIYFVFDGNSLLTGDNSILKKNYGNKIFIGIDFEDDVDRFNKLSLYQNTLIVDAMAQKFHYLTKNNVRVIGGNGVNFNNFLIEEIIKYLHLSNIKIKDLNLIGCSMGAYFSLQMLFLNEYINFVNVYLFSPSIWFNEEIIKDLKENKLNNNLNFNVNLWVGLKEPKLFAKKIPINYYEDALKVKEVLEEKGNTKLNFVIDKNGSHGFKWWSHYIINFIK